MDLCKLLTEIIQAIYNNEYFNVSRKSCFYVAVLINYGDYEKLLNFERIINEITQHLGAVQQYIDVGKLLIQNNESLDDPYTGPVDLQDAFYTLRMVNQLVKRKSKK